MHNVTGTIDLATLDRGRLLEQAERQIIEATLRTYNNRREVAAEVLGMCVRTLQMRLRHWRLKEVRIASSKSEDVSCEQPRRDAEDAMPRQPPSGHEGEV